MRFFQYEIATMHSQRQGTRSNDAAPFYFAIFSRYFAAEPTLKKS